MTDRQSHPTLRTTLLLIAFAVALALLHVSVNHRYGIHRDEYYFIECGQHLDWGYADHPPMIALITRVGGAVFGHTTTGLRILSVAALASLVVLVGLLARRLGGGTYAQLLAAASLGLSVLGLRAGAFINIPTFEILLWTATAYALVLVIQRSPKYWLLVGLIAGLALMTKLSAAFLGLGIVLGLLLTPARTHFKSPWLWIGGAIAMLIYLPNLIWQFQHDWATLEFMRNLREDEGTSPLEYILGTMFFANIVATPIWLAGIYFYFRDPAGRPYRLLGIVALTVYFAFLVLGGKVYYPASAFPILFAAGPVVLERLFKRTWSRTAYAAAIVVSSLAFMPVAMPLLPIEKTDAYARTVFGFITDNPDAITYDLRGEFGWHEQVVTVAAVYDSLTPEEQAACTILTGNYGQAGAINFHGPALGLPRAISGHNNHYFWGPGDATGEVVIAYGYSQQGLETLFRDVTPAAMIRSPQAQEEERELTVYLCRDPVAPLAELWPRIKHYN